jgi:hypothetical protein
MSGRIELMTDGVTSDPEQFLVEEARTPSKLVPPFDEPLVRASRWETSWHLPVQRTDRPKICSFEMLLSEFECPEVVEFWYRIPGRPEISCRFATVKRTPRPR